MGGFRVRHKMWSVLHFRCLVSVGLFLESGLRFSARASFRFRIRVTVGCG